MTTTIRVTLTRSTTPQAVDRFLPSNYRITGYDPGQDWLYIEGEDRAGWTAEDYVIPRLASGLIYAAVVETETPVSDLGGQDPHPRFGADENDLDEE